jgi:hypothetical protein
MQLVLERIHSDDQRTVAEIPPGEVVTQAVAIRVDGKLREFTVFLRANVLSNLDASVVYGDELIEELLRFDPATLNTLYGLVGKYRRGVRPDLPAMLLDSYAHQPDAFVEPHSG